MSKLERQLTDTVVMVRPDYFGFNIETGVDNRFQHQPTVGEIEVREAALREFEQTVEKLASMGVRVVTIPSRVYANGQETPDAVFPNNWFSTHPGKLVLYPMKAENRRWERQPLALTAALEKIGIVYHETLDLTADEQVGDILEGTGSLVLDRAGRVAYALESQRTTQKEFLKWCRLMGYAPHFFHASGIDGAPIYHTNVLMSVGEKFAVVCTEAITDSAESQALLASLDETGHEIVEIESAQMYAMCGNILQVRSQGGNQLVVMSETALRAFDPGQMRTIERHGQIVPVMIPTIEKVGGGSARCTLAEVHY